MPEPEFIELTPEMMMARAREIARSDNTAHPDQRIVDLVGLAWRAGAAERHLDGHPIWEHVPTLDRKWVHDHSSELGKLMHSEASREHGDLTYLIKDTEMYKSTRFLQSLQSLPGILNHHPLGKRAMITGLLMIKEAHERLEITAEAVVAGLITLGVTARVGNKSTQQASNGSAA